MRMHEVTIPSAEPLPSQMICTTPSPWRDLFGTYQWIALRPTNQKHTELTPDFCQNGVHIDGYGCIIRRYGPADYQGSQGWIYWPSRMTSQECEVCNQYNSDILQGKVRRLWVPGRNHRVFTVSKVIQNTVCLQADVSEQCVMIITIIILTRPTVQPGKPIVEGMTLNYQRCNNGCTISRQLGSRRRRIAPAMIESLDSKMES